MIKILEIDPGTYHMITMQQLILVSLLAEQFSDVSTLLAGSRSTSECDFEKQKVRHNIEDSYQQLKKNRERKKKGQSTKNEETNGPNWNIQLFKNNEKASVLKKQLSKQKESLKRNLGR